VSDCGVPGPAIWRRDLFKGIGGYKPELKWHCDWFALQVLAFRHGVCFIPRTTSIIRATPEAYSAAGQRQAETQRPVLQRLLLELAKPEYSDVLPRIGASGVFRQFGAELARAAATIPNPPQQLVEPLREIMIGHATNLICGGEPEVRAAVMRFLPRYGRDSFRFYFLVSGMRNDADSTVREAAVEARRRIGRTVPLRIVVKERLRRRASRTMRWLDKFLRPAHHEHLQRIEAAMSHMAALIGQLGWALHCINKNLEKLVPPDPPAEVLPPLEKPAEKATKSDTNSTNEKKLIEKKNVDTPKRPQAA
jgi:hypothetical protein